jgi:alpha-D-xyloside xylohydrolase
MAPVERHRQGESARIDTLHYRLMPYFYSLAWRVTNEGYTIMRPLVFDYQTDSNVFSIKDQFMYGPAFLVNPVTTAGATSRSVYLPAGTWYDFWTGSTTNGGSNATANAPLSQIPCTSRRGRLFRWGPRFNTRHKAPIPWKSGSTKGKTARSRSMKMRATPTTTRPASIRRSRFPGDDTAQQLTIGARAGSYTGMPATRTFNIVWVAANHGNGVDVTATADQVVKYDGSAVVASAK